MRPQTLICVVALMFAALAGWASLTLSPQMMGRLRPSAVPLGLVSLLMLSGLAVIWRGRQAPRSAQSAMTCETEACEPVSARAMICAVMAVTVMALGIRSQGVILSCWLAATITVVGVAGASGARVMVGRVLVIGLGIAGLCALVFVVALRQSLPLWPAWFPVIVGITS
jgi:hypothetical protein